MKDLTSFQRDLMYVIAGNRAMTVPQIMDGLNSYYDERINHQRLYPNLRVLAEKGILDSEETDSDDSIYWLTDLGVKKIRNRQDFENEQLQRNIQHQ